MPGIFLINITFFFFHDLANPVFDGVGLADSSQEQGQCFFIGLSCSIITIGFYSFSLSLLSVYRLVLWGWGLQTDMVYITLSQPCTADLFLIIIIIWLPHRNHTRALSQLSSSRRLNSIRSPHTTHRIMVIEQAPHITLAGHNIC